MMDDKRVKARIAVAAVVAAVAGATVAGVAGAGAQGVPPYTSSTTSSTLPSTTTTTSRPQPDVRLRVALRYRRNQPVSGAIVVRLRCRVAGNASGFVVTQSQGCFVRANGVITILDSRGNRSARRDRNLRLKGQKVNVAPRETETVRLKYERRGMIHRALRRAPRSVDAHLEFDVSDEFGNEKTLRRKIHLRSGAQTL